MQKLTLSIREAAEAIGISETKMYQLAKSQGFPSVVIGKRILVSTEGLKLWVEEQAAIGYQV